VPLVFAALFVLFVVAATLKGSLPPVVIGIYGVVSLLTFLTYRSDKLAAQYGRWRTKESTLLVLGLFGGGCGYWYTLYVVEQNRLMAFPDDESHHKNAIVCNAPK